MIPEICKEIERVFNRRFETSSEFSELADMIQERTHTYISPTTLKRMWGYLHEDVNPRKSTLELLAKFLGYRNYDAFRQHYGEAQSHPVISNHITNENLVAGQRVSLSWAPDRKCVVEYLGDNSFKVVSAENTKLSVGDTFRCSLMIEHEPLYIDGLRHNGSAPVSYVAGNKDGITFKLL